MVTFPFRHLNLDMCLIRHDQEQSQAGFWSALRNALILLYSVNTVLWPVRATMSLHSKMSADGYTESATLNEPPKPKSHSTSHRIHPPARGFQINDPRHFQGSKYCHKVCHIFEYFQVASSP